MSRDIDTWTERLARLRVDRSRGFPAPHKALLLLSLLDMVDEGVVSSPEVTLTPELADTFQSYWRALFPESKPGAMYLPFFHLRSDGFWNLVPVAGCESELSHMRKATSYVELRRTVRHAALDEDFWEVLQDAKMRQQLRRALVGVYFDHSERQVLSKTESERRAVCQYRQTLLSRSPRRFTLKHRKPPPAAPKVRDSGFRSAIQRLYDHTCAFCGFRVITPTGSTALEAAHIVPFAVSRNDDPRNGIGLCRLHHWAFDEGLLGCEGADDLVIVVSPLLDSRRPTEDRLCELDGKRLLLPRESQHRPAAKAIRWHYQNCLQR